MKDKRVGDKRVGDRSCLVFVDIQKGFMNDNTKHLENRIERFLRGNDNVFDHIVATRYINNKDTACYKFEGWKQCMEGTEEVDLIPIVEAASERVFDKDKYSCWNDEFKGFIEEKGITTLYFCGVNTGCCVLHSVLDCYNDVISCYVLKDLCASTDGSDMHQTALKLMKSLITGDRVILSYEAPDIGEEVWQRG